jgi:DedD protein
MADPADLNLDELRRRGRRRLIGAIVLALVAAVVVPMLLESDPRPLGEDVSVRIPPVDDGKFVSKLGEPRPADAPRKSLADAEKGVLTPPTRASAETRPPAKAPEPAKATEAPKAAEPAKTADAGKAATAPASAPATASAPAPANAAEPPREGFVVQLAAFSDDKGANALAGKLKRAGYPAYTETITTSRGTLWRVRVGGYPSRDAAAQSRDKLKAEGHAGIVVPAQ